MLRIALTIDIDSDHFDQSLISKSSHDPKPTWRGLEEGVPLISDLIDFYKDSSGCACKATWFIRADSQIGYYFGDDAYLFSKYKELWDRFILRGHELAWHPHLYKFQNHVWEQELDEVELFNQMESSLRAIYDQGWTIKASRIGEAYFSNAISANLKKLGIKVDSSALPGRIRKDGERTIDWLNVPRKPYYPSANDYRIPADRMVSHLEIPFTMVDVIADYDTIPLKRYVDLSFWHRSIKDGIEASIQENMIFNTIIHPSTVIPGIVSKPHGLLSFSMDEVKKNLDFILDTAEKKSIEYQFVTISEIKQFYSV